MGSLRFLVVDDATFTRDLIKKTLRNVFPGCEVYDTPSARKAQVMLRQQAVDVILSDWEMPDMSGEEFLRWIRADATYAKTPFIIVSSRGEREFVAKAIEAGVNDYLGKPFTPDDLLQKVSKQLRRIGKTTTVSSRAGGSTQGVAFASVDVLGAKNISAPVAGKPAAEVAPAAAPADTAKKTTGTNAQAQLRFASGLTATCVVRSMTLKGLQGFVRRENTLPALFEQAVVSIVSPDGKDVARLNGYVDNLAAVQPGIDSEGIRIGINFVDDDPQKLEQLSLYIARL